MRVGTISLNINTPDFNYGAMLHSWAFQQYLLRQEEIDATEVIDYTMPVLEKTHRRMPIIDSVLHCRVRTCLKQITEYGLYRERLKKFDRFVEQNLLISEKKYTQKKLNSAVLPYDTIICESDVIWSPGFCGGHFDKSFFLALDSMRNMRRIAYAPSMSNGDLNQAQEIELKKYLKYVDMISCRESYEKKILEKHTNKEVTHVVDPVLLLSEVDYKPILEKRMIENDYILLYLPVDDNEKLRRYAEEFAKKYGYYILEISTKLRSEEKECYRCLATAGIEEFLSGIKYAKCVFTNSFHAICFSVIFHREFYAFSRAYAGKVRDICEVLELNDRYFPDNKFVERDFINYCKVDEKVNFLKEKSELWLKKALNLPGVGATM